MFTYTDNILHGDYQPSLEGIDRLVYVKTPHIKHSGRMVLLMGKDLSSDFLHKPFDPGIQYHVDILLSIL